MSDAISTGNNNGIKTTSWTPERQREYMQNYYILNKEKINKANRQWREDHKEKEYNDHKKWRANNPVKFKEQVKRANTKKRSTPHGKLSKNISLVQYIYLLKMAQREEKNGKLLLDILWMI